MLKEGAGGALLHLLRQIDVAKRAGRGRDLACHLYKQGDTVGRELTETRVGESDLCGILMMNCSRLGTVFVRQGLFN